MVRFTASVVHWVGRLVARLAGNVNGRQWLVCRLRDLAGRWHFDRLGDLDHDGRVDHLGRWAVADLRSVAGVWEIRRDRVNGGDGNDRDCTSFVVGTLARNVMVTGRLGIDGCSLGANDFVGCRRDCDCRGGI